MKTILDEIEQVENTKKTFSRLAFLNLVISFGVFYYNIKLSLKVFEGALDVKYLDEMMWLFLFFLTTGVICTTLSFVKKEPSKYTKWISGILNVLLFVVFFGLMIFDEISKLSG